MFFYCFSKRFKQHEIIYLHISNWAFSCLPDKFSGERVKQVMEHIWKFQEFCNSMTKLETDSYEYAYLKAIVLFSPGESAFLNQVNIRDITDFIGQMKIIP